MLCSRDVVVGRADAAGREHVGVAGPAGVDCLDDRGLVVRHHARLRHADSDLAEPRRDVREIGVRRSTREDLVADDDQTRRDRLPGFAHARSPPTCRRRKPKACTKIREASMRAYDPRERRRSHARAIAIDASPGNATVEIDLQISKPRMHDIDDAPLGGRDPKGTPDEVRTGNLLRCRCRQPVCKFRRAWRRLRRQDAERLRTGLLLRRYCRGRQPVVDVLEPRQPIGRQADRD